MTGTLLAFIAISLTCTMLATRQYILGFPCAIFWTILGAFYYTQFTTPWVDWEYYMFLASMLGMTPFSMFAMFSLRRQDKSFIDEAGDIVTDEKLEDKEIDIETLEPKDRASKIRARAKRRRTYLNSPSYKALLRGKTK